MRCDRRTLHFSRNVIFASEVKFDRWYRRNEKGYRQSGRRATWPDSVHAKCSGEQFLCIMANRPTTRQTCDHTTGSRRSCRERQKLTALAHFWDNTGCTINVVRWRRIWRSQRKSFKTNATGECLVDLTLIIKTNEYVWQQVSILAGCQELLLSTVAVYHGSAISVVAIR